MEQIPNQTLTNEIENETDFENIEQGFVLFYRSSLKKPFMQDPFYASVWFHLIMLANHKDKFHNGTIIKRGSFKTGRLSLSKTVGIEPSKLERILEYFETTEKQIEQQKTNKYRIITILNYDKFQIMNNSQQQHNSKPTADEQQKTQLINNININNNKNKNNIYREPKNFEKPTLEQIQAYIKEKGYTISAEKFFNHYQSNGWKVGKNQMRCWKSACATWQSNNNNFGGNVNNGTNKGSNTARDFGTQDTVNSKYAKHFITGRPDDEGTGS